MSQSSFPTSTSGVFIPSLWETAGGGGDLTRAQADARYLKFPTGQGTETIPTLVVSGQATIDSIVIKQPTGTNNNVVGKNTLNNTTSASYDNFAFGANTATGVLTGNNNTFMGNAGFGAITSASNNTSIGANSGIALTTGNNNVFLGQGTGVTLETGSNNIFIGSGANTTLNTASQSTALGYLSSVGANNATALGHGTNASGANSTAVGHNAASSGVQSIAIGYNVVSNSTGSVSMGASSVAGGASATAIGASSNAAAADNTAIGASSTAFGASTTAIGKSAIAQGASSIAIGNSSVAGNFNNSTAIGVSAAAGNGGTNATAIGYTSAAGGASSIAIGANSIANGDNSTAIGASATCGTFTKSTAIGKDATATANNQVVLGTSTETIIIPRITRFLDSPIIMRKADGTQTGVTNATVLFPTSTYAGSYTGLTYSAGTFTNSNSYTIAVQVNCCVYFSTATNSMTIKINHSTYGVFGYAEIAVNNGTTNVRTAPLAISQCFPLASGATFNIIGESTTANTFNAVSTISVLVL